MSIRRERRFRRFRVFFVVGGGAFGRSRICLTLVRAAFRVVVRLKSVVSLLRHFHESFPLVRREKPGDHLRARHFLGVLHRLRVLAEVLDQPPAERERGPGLELRAEARRVAVRGGRPHERTRGRGERDGHADVDRFENDFSTGAHGVIRRRVASQRARKSSRRLRRAHLSVPTQVEHAQAFQRTQGVERQGVVPGPQEVAREV
mmetsp:Transcript_14671/g.61926  ORF Transcript_14671/g.61926 Transcript_14671/m.61926 type:complete len:204 (+) Transcript_14671:779-1390(+)